jgi:hypothetical protein
MHARLATEAPRRRLGVARLCRGEARKRIQGEEFMLSGVGVLRRPTERNVAGADVSGDAAENR